MIPLRGLAARLYLFSIVLVLVVAVAVPWLTHFVLRPAGLPRQINGLAEFVVHSVAPLRSDPTALHLELARVRDELHAGVSLYDPTGALLASNVAPALTVSSTLPPPSRGCHSPFSGGPHGHGHGHVNLLLRLGDGAYAVFSPPPPLSPPDRSLLGWGFVVALAGCAAFSVLLARSLAAPLTRLAATARAFGAGDLRARTGFARDDEFGAVGAAFDDMAERIARLLRAQKELLANVSHELRTPMARIRVALELATEGDTATAQRSLLDIQQDLDELEQLVSDVLENARLELKEDRGTLEGPTVRRAPVEVTRLLERARTRFSTAHPRRALEVLAAEGLGSVRADEMLLRRALDNILDNAAKYSDSGEAVTLRVTAPGEALVFEVEDRGIGIDGEDLARVGTPFFRTDRSRTRTTGGVGLGVSLSRRIAEAHGGTLVLESGPQRGTRVRITVPRGPAA